jgi:hypothetical protein
VARSVVATDFVGLEKMANWHIATSEEGHYYGDYPTREEAIAEGIAEGHEVFYVGQSRPPCDLSEGIYADAIVESAVDNLEEDWCLEFATFEPSKDQLNILQLALREAVDSWIKSQRLEPTWFIVARPERVEVP